MGIELLSESRWTLSRKVLGSSKKIIGIALAKAILESHMYSTLKYRESGVITLSSGKQLSFHKNYYVLKREQKVFVYFDEALTQLFHRMHFEGNARAKGTHLCHLDTYTISYQKENADLWTSVCQVQGPRKCYTIETIYNRDC